VLAPSLSEFSSIAFSDSVTDELAASKRTTDFLLLSISHMASAEITAASISDLEAKHYYHGLCPKSVLVARTGKDTWEPPTGPEAYLPCKELRPPGYHPLNQAFGGPFGCKIEEFLDSKGVKWTSMDVVRIGIVDEDIAPVILWIEVKPNTLSREAGSVVVKECKQFLVLNEFPDVEVEIRELAISQP